MNLIAQKSRCDFKPWHGDALLALPDCGILGKQWQSTCLGCKGHHLSNTGTLLSSYAYAHVNGALPSAGNSKLWLQSFVELSCGQIQGLIIFLLTYFYNLSRSFFFISDCTNMDFFPWLFFDTSVEKNSLPF